MSCWVVPVVAAELWQVPVDQILQMIEDGVVPSKQDYHFLLVDVAPESPEMAPAFGKVRADGRRTFVPARSVDEKPMVFATSSAWTEAADADDADGDEMDEELTPMLRTGGAALTAVAQAECSWVHIRQQAAQRRQRPMV